MVGVELVMVRSMVMARVRASSWLWLVMVRVVVIGWCARGFGGTRARHDGLGHTPAGHKGCALGPGGREARGPYARACRARCALGPYTRGWEAQGPCTRLGGARARHEAWEEQGSFT